jgi:IS5 family transposase
MARIRYQRPGIDFGFANRKRKSKRLCYQIALVKGPKADKKRRKLYRRLIKVANEVFDMGCRCYGQLSGCEDVPTEYWQLDHYLTMMAPAIDQCERRILKGEKVDACEKIVSIFEDHTDIIRRGKSSSPTEFGHKVLFTAGKTGLITQYQVLRGNPGDGDFLPQIIETHKHQFGRAPHSISADRRFFSEDNESAAYREGVKQVSICKPGYRNKQRKQIEKERWFKNLQKFRAGIEGIISTLMRGYGLKRCIWKGWEAFKRYVALSVVTFNLRKIAVLL